MSVEAQATASGPVQDRREQEIVGEHVRTALSLEIRDNGRARDLASESGGRGLLGMRERAELLGGRLSAGPADGGGFLVRADIPLQPADRARSTSTELS